MIAWLSLLLVNHFSPNSEGYSFLSPASQEEAVATKLLLSETLAAGHKGLGEESGDEGRGLHPLSASPGQD